MPCTTLLVGKNASNDGSTIIARTDDGHFDTKKMIIVTPDKQPRKYVSKIGHLEIELPDNPMRYSACPNVEPSDGTWAAAGINEVNVGMTATETITTNARVMGADPYVKYQKAQSKKEKDIPGGIGEEDLVVLVLPYIKSAREGVIRLGSLLEKYGTYESNGIAFNDNNEIWWLESIGGHHWIARKVNDNEYVVMPNQFGLDKFDLDDAYGAQKENMCSKDLKEFISKYNLDLGQNGVFNPRLAFGSHDDSDHSYNTPRAWYMCRFFNPRTYKWDGPDAFYTPESDDIPWSLVPERKISVEDVKQVLSSYYQGTDYNPYGRDNPKKGIYRPIGISRTDDTIICQIRNGVKDSIKGIVWFTFGSNAFNAMIPFYANVNVLPEYLTNTTLNVDTNSFYWATRLIGALADAHYGKEMIYIERYQKATSWAARGVINKYDEIMKDSDDLNNLVKANQEAADIFKRETQKTLNTVLYVAMEQMKNGYNRFDN